MAFISYERTDIPGVAEEMVATNRLLLRIAEALERLSPALAAVPSPRMADLSDLRRTDAVTISHIAQTLDHFAQEQNVAPNSDAFLKSIYEYEQQIKEAYGTEAINELPWNKAAGGPIFDRYPDYARRKEATDNRLGESIQAGKAATPSRPD